MSKDQMFKKTMVNFIIYLNLLYFQDIIISESPLEEKKDRKKKRKKTKTHHKKTGKDVHLDSSFFTDKKNGAETFYNFYVKEPHRQFRNKKKKDQYIMVIDYLIKNTRSIWEPDSNQQIWDVRTDITVDYLVLPDFIH